MHAFEDFVAGDSVRAGSITVSEADIVAFASRYDAQSFHVDPEAAKASFVGRLIASGWHSCSLLMRLIAEDFLLDSTGMGAPGIEEVKWLRPVLPGDRLSARRTVLESKASRSRPEMGLVRFRLELLDGVRRHVAHVTGFEDALGGLAHRHLRRVVFADVAAVADHHDDGDLQSHVQ